MTNDKIKIEKKIKWIFFILEIWLSKKHTDFFLSQAKSLKKIIKQNKKSGLYFFAKGDDDLN